MSMPLLVQPNMAVSLSSGSQIAILLKRLLYYHAYQEVDVTLTGDFKTDRELIFGRGGFIKDAPLVKAVMMITGYRKARYYVTPDETFEDQIQSIYATAHGRYMFIELASALMARVTNYFQALQGLWDEDPEEIKSDIDAIIDEMVYRLANPNYLVIFKVYLYDSPPAYEVLVEVYEKIT